MPGLATTEASWLPGKRWLWLSLRNLSGALSTLSLAHQQRGSQSSGQHEDNRYVVVDSMHAAHVMIERT
jgi:hypothetical protein